MANDGKSFAILTGTANIAGATYDRLRLSVMTQDQKQFAQDLPVTTLVESSSPLRESVLALAKLEFQQDQPVVTFVAEGHVVGRIQIGQKVTAGTVSLPVSAVPGQCKKPMFSLVK